MDLTEKLFEIFEEFIKTTEYELLFLTFQNESGRDILRIYIDKEGGVTIDDCVKVSKGFAPILDQLDVIKTEYMLEVSSPGVDRPLHKLKHYERFKGSDVKIKLKTPFIQFDQKRLIYKGILLGVKDGDIELKLRDERVVILPYNLIKRANIIYKF